MSELEPRGASSRPNGSQTSQPPGFGSLAGAQTTWVDFFQYNPAERHRRRILLDLLDRLPESDPTQDRHKTVLDVGCGDGRILLELSHRRPELELYATDVGDSPAPKVLGPRLKEFYRMDFSKEPLKRRFHILICSEVLEHIPDDQTAVRNLFAMCGGVALVSVPSGVRRKTDLLVGHYRHYTPQGITGLFEGAGFHVLECFRWGIPFHSLYRAMLDWTPGSVMKNFGKVRYSSSEKLLCQILTVLFYLNLRGAGPQLFLVARRPSS